MLTDDIAAEFFNSILFILEDHKEYEFNPLLLGDIYTYCERYVYHLYLDNYSTQSIFNILNHHIKYLYRAIDDLVINTRYLTEKSLSYSNPALILFSYFAYYIYQSDLIYTWATNVPYKPVSHVNLTDFFITMYKKSDNIQKKLTKTIYKQEKLF